MNHTGPIYRDTAVLLESRLNQYQAHDHIIIIRLSVVNITEPVLGIEPETLMLLASAINQ